MASSHLGDSAAATPLLQEWLQEDKRQSTRHGSIPKDGTHANHVQTHQLCTGQVQTTSAEPPQNGKVSHHANSEQPSRNQSPANAGNTGRSSSGCLWKAKQLKEMFSLIERGFLGPHGQFWRPESVQRTSSHLCFSVLMPCCFTALSERWESVDRDFKGKFRV